MPIAFMIVPVFGIIGGCAVLITAMTLVSRHISEKRRSSAFMPMDDIVRRLERMEQTLDATALEVERVAEANRFVAKLLSERSSVTTPR